jgi:hypothetical protein
MKSKNIKNEIISEPGTIHRITTLTTTSAAAIEIVYVPTVTPGSKVFGSSGC